MAGRGQRDLVVNFLGNVRDFLRGTQDSGNALEDLEQDFKAVDQASDRAHTSMQTAARKTAASLDSAAKEGGGKFKESGREIGSEFMQNVGESIGSGQANLGDTLFGTIGGLVNLPGIGAVAAVGAGLAGLIGTAFVGRMKAEKEKMQKAITDLLTLMESGQGIIDRTDAINNAIDTLGGGDRAKGLAVVRDMMAATGLSADQIGSALAGEINPQTSTLVGQLQGVVDRAGAFYRVTHDLTPEQARSADEAQRLLDIISLQPGILAQVNDLYQVGIGATDQIRRNAAETNRQFELAYGWGSKASRLGLPPFTSPTTRTP